MAVIPPFGFNCSLMPILIESGNDERAGYDSAIRGCKRRLAAQGAGTWFSGAVSQKRTSFTNFSAAWCFKCRVDVENTYLIDRLMPLMSLDWWFAVSVRDTSLLDVDTQT